MKNRKLKQAYQLYSGQRISAGHLVRTQSGDTICIQSPIYRRTVASFEGKRLYIQESSQWAIPFGQLGEKLQYDVSLLPRLNPNITGKRVANLAKMYKIPYNKLRKTEGLPPYPRKNRP